MTHSVTRRTLFGATCLAVPALGLSGREAGATTRTIRIGHVNPADSNYGRGAQAVAAAIAASPVLAPALRVEVHPNGSLGGEMEMGRACAEGTLEMFVGASLITATFAEEAGLLDAPFLFRDTAHARAVLDGPIGVELARLLTEKGLPVLAWAENGVRHVTARRPVRNAGELRGLRIRIPQSEVMLTSFRAMGAAADSLAFPQLFEALRTGRFEAQENPLNIIISARLHEVQSHVSMTGHIYSAGIVLASPDLLEDLSEPQRAALREAARAGAAACRAAVDETERQGVDLLRSRGMTIVTDIDRASFAAAAAPTLAAFSQRLPGNLLARIQSQTV